MRLVAVELDRFRSRRAIALLSLAGLLVAVVLVGATAWSTRPLTEADRTDAAAQADLEGQRPELQQEVRACRADPAGYLGPDATAGDCAEALVPSAESYYPRERLDFGRALQKEGIGLALVVVGLMVVAGCTFAGADWSSGSLTHQLIFVPRRTRLWVAKATAVMIGSGLVALVVLGGFWLALGVILQGRGIDVPSSGVAEVAWHVARAVALSMAAGVGMFALTMLFRHTVATLALLFVYSVGGEIAVNLVPFEGAGRWSVGNNALGWLAPHHRYFDATISCTPGSRCSSMQAMTHLEAGTYLSAALVIVVVVSLVWFRRADV
jgi:ABC-2 family transporter protein